MKMMKTLTAIALLALVPIAAWAQTIGNTTTLDDDSNLIAAADRPCWATAIDAESNAETTMNVHPVSYKPGESQQQLSAAGPGIAALNQAMHAWASCESNAHTVLDAQLAAYHGVVISYWGAFYEGDSAGKTTACAKMQQVKTHTRYDAVLAKENTFLQNHCR